MKSQIKTLASNFRLLNRGFTLPELLIAMGIMSLLVTIAGSGFIILLQENKKAEFDSQRRTNLNRALDYIANEVRMANQVAPGTNTGEVMTLAIAGTVGRSRDLSLRGRTFNPNAVTRTYSVVADAGVWDDGDNNSKSIRLDGAFLVNGIKAPVPVPDDNDNESCPSGTVQNPNNDSNCVPICPSGSTLTGSDGFYACINGSQVDIYLYGLLSDDPKQPKYKERLEVKSTVYTRTQPTW
jgi:prepilin-type N-terminal cleavage/methylation domain-containing protein